MSKHLLCHSLLCGWVLYGSVLGCSNAPSGAAEPLTTAPSEALPALPAAAAPETSRTQTPETQTPAASPPSSPQESPGDVSLAPAVEPPAPNGAASVDAVADSGAVAVAEPDAGGGDPNPGAGAAGAGNTGALRPITLWLAGDSTVQNYVAGNTQGAGGTELEGWGQELAAFFKPEVTVNNQAIGGRSVAFYLYTVVRDAAGTPQCVDDQGNPLYQLDAAGNRIDNTQWSRVKAGITAGDFLLIQFGTNDETHDCPRFVSLQDFQTDLGIMADTVRAQGATPLFVTPMSHRSFNGAAINNTLLPYANAMKAEAARVGVQVLDLNLRSVEYFNSVGNAFLATNIFDTGTTHFIAPGAKKMAELVVGEIRSDGGPLAAYLK